MRAISMGRAGLPLLCCLLLGACMAPGANAPGAAPEVVPVTQQAVGAARVCAPGDWAGLVGKPLAQARIPANITHRVIREGQLVTAEYQENRLNLLIDRADLVVEVSCG